MQVNMLEAKNRLSSLIVAAEQGEEVLIARNGVPVARLVPYFSPRVKPPGAWKGLGPYSTDWRIRRDRAGDRTALPWRRRRCACCLIRNRSVPLPVTTDFPSWDSCGKL